MCLGGGAQPRLMITAAVPFGPLRTFIPGKQTVYLSLKEGLHEASEEVVFFFKAFVPNSAPLGQELRVK